MASPSASPPAAAVRRSGSVTFAGALFVVAGAFNLLDGIVALANADYFIADRLLFGDLTAWGVWWLFVGAAQALTGIFLLMRSTLSVVFGITIAAVNALTQLLWIGTYPGWAIAAIVVDFLIIWVLTTHIDEFA